MSKAIRQEDAGRQQAWGVVGGMGPIASAEFLKTIYEFWEGEREQDAPIVYLVSDPTIPDRTERFLNHNEEELLERFIAILSQLSAMNVVSVVICCVTIHHLLDRLPESFASKIISLIDVALSGVLQSDQRHLLICTEGTRRIRVFERNPLWPLIKERVVVPDDVDQRSIHNFIYEVKSNRHKPEHLDLIDHLLKKHRLNSLLAGCTEIHSVLKRKQLAPSKNHSWSYIDPLMVIAEEIARGRRLCPAGSSSASAQVIPGF
jgi:aspartate racemase